MSAGLRIPVTRIEVGDEEAHEVARVLASGWITMGPEVEMFEREFAAAVGADEACAVSSATTGLHLALIVSGVQPGDEVITVSHSFIATTDAIRHAGAMPVFVDVESRSGNLDSSHLEAACGPKTKAILAPHQLGMPCDLAAVCAFARARGLVVIEDAACAIGSELQWEGRWDRIGRPHGDLACFSFHPRKVLTTGDGGMITSRRPDWIARARQLRTHGRTRPSHHRHDAARVARETYAEPGFNFRMTDLQAAVGRVQLERLGGIVERRRALATRYRAGLQHMPHVTLPCEPQWARSNWQSFAVRLDPSLRRDAIMQRMRDDGIATLPGVMCAHREPAYPAGSYRTTAAGLRQGEAHQDHGLILPLFPQMTHAEQDDVIAALAAACAVTG